MSRPIREHAVLAHGLVRRFGNFTAVAGIDLEVKPGEIFGFLGANGAGKTTAIRMLTGLLKPTEGQAWVAGVPVHETPERVKRKIGYMSQRFSLYDDLTIGENLEFYGGAYGLDRSTIRHRGDALLERVGLTGGSGRLTGSLPLGFKQRLALASANLHEPEILFLDEPTGGVDPVARRAFWDLIYELGAVGTTVFVTTHYMDEAEYCGRVSIMVDGRIKALDTPQELKRRYDVRTMQDVFLEAVKR
jgi:ABC-2 type transport system ATP-binding protein